MTGRETTTLEGSYNSELSPWEKLVPVKVRQ
jgi:hypothetical protein